MHRRLVFLSLAAIGIVLSPFSYSVLASSEPTVTVHTSTVIATVHSAIVGVNNNIADNSAAQLKALAGPYYTMGLTSGRFPGSSNVFDWMDAAPNTMTNFCNTKTKPVSRDGDFDAYAQDVAIPDRLSVEITTNYDTSGWPTCKKPGSPALAAAWVKYSNITKRYGFQWWEVGNEEYIPGDTDEHTKANGFPTGPNNRYTYASVEPSFYQQMKREDPSIKIGIPVTGVASSYDGWDKWVLTHAAFDYLSYHYYPLRFPNATDAAALHVAIDDGYVAGSHSVSAAIGALRAELVAVQKCSGACMNIPISVSEWSTVPDKPGPQSFSIVQALFAAEVIGEFANSGVSRAEFWNSNGCEEDGLAGQPPTYSWQDLGTAGLLSYQVPDALQCPDARMALPFGTILPVGRAFQIYSQSGFVREGVSALAVDSSDSNIRSYASSSNGSIVIILINLAQGQPFTTQVRVTGFTGGSRLQELQYTKAIYDDSRNGGPFYSPTAINGGAWSSPLTITLPPWSITSLTLGGLRSV